MTYSTLFPFSCLTVVVTFLLNAKFRLRSFAVTTTFFPMSRGSQVQKPGMKVTIRITIRSTRIMTIIHGISLVTPVLTTVTVTKR